MDSRVELQIPPSLNWHFIDAEEYLRLGEGQVMKEYQLQIGMDIRVELQIPPSAHLNFSGAE
jgi:hypothetical protein